MSDARDEITFWKVAPGEQASMWEECRDSGCITINWMNHRNFDKLDTLDDIRRALLKQETGHRGGPSIFWFAKKIHPGHVVVANKGLSRVAGIGRVTSKYLHPNHPKNPRKHEPEHRHALRVEWLIKDPIDLPKGFFIQLTVEPLDAEQCYIIKGAYFEAYPEYKKTLDALFPRAAESEFEEARDIEEIKRNPHIG